MKKLIASVMAALGLSTNAGAAPVVLVDPNTILMSLPTISDDLPPVEDAGTIGDNDLVFHEDDWAQVEFFPAARLSEIQAKMKELQAFERANRVKAGWKSLYVRKIARTPVLQAPGALARLEAELGATAKPSPLLATGSTVTGRIRNGFHLPLGGNIALYGVVHDGAIPVLGASVGRDPDNTKLTTAFAKLNAADHLILVDWLSQMILTGANSDGKIEVWRP